MTAPVQCPAGCVRLDKGDAFRVKAGSGPIGRTILTTWDTCPRCDGTGRAAVPGETPAAPATEGTPT